MLRRNFFLLRVSPFSVYLKDLGSRGKIPKGKNPVGLASKGYRALTPGQKKALQKRATKMSYPALDAYNRFQREFSCYYTHLPPTERQRQVAALWAKVKAKGTVAISKSIRNGSSKKKIKSALKQFEAKKVFIKKGEKAALKKKNKVMKKFGKKKFGKKKAKISHKKKASKK